MFILMTLPAFTTGPQILSLNAFSGFSAMNTGFYSDFLEIGLECLNPLGVLFVEIKVLLFLYTVKISELFKFPMVTFDSLLPYIRLNQREILLKCLHQKYIRELLMRGFLFSTLLSSH